jgi:hypothetical protein
MEFEGRDLEKRIRPIFLGESFQPIFLIFENILTIFGPYYENFHFGLPQVIFKP